MKSYSILNFTYNGFTGGLTGGKAKYTATFKQWTTDPGIALMSCSDGQERNIPGWAIENAKKKDFPEQDLTEAREITKKCLIHLGAPSSSN